MKTQPATNDFAPPTLKDSDFRLSPSDFPTFDFATIDYPLDWRSFLHSATRKISQKFAQNPLGSLSLYSIKARRRMTGGGSACAVGVAALPSVRPSVALCAAFLPVVVFLYPCTVSAALRAFYGVL